MPLGHRTGRSVWLGVGLGTAGMVGACLLLEALVRVTGYHRMFAQADAVIGYTLSPRFTHTVPIQEHAGGVALLQTNNLGLRRDHDTASKKPTGTVRVLVLGDSQTEGILANDETYSSVLEQALNDPGRDDPGRGGFPVEVLNAGVGGYSPLLEYLRLRELGTVVQPDVVVLALYVGNGIAELGAHVENFGGFGPQFVLPFLAQKNGEWQILPPGTADGFLGRADCLLQAYLRSYALVRRVLRWRAQGDGEQGPLQRAVAHCPGCFQSLWQPFTTHGDVTALGENFARFDNVLDRFQREVAALHARLLVAVIPTKLEVEGLGRAGIVLETMHTLGLEYDAPSFEANVRTRMLELVAQHGITVLDLFPALRRRYLERRQPLYWEWDWHLNIEGNRTVAQALLPMVSRFLQPEATPQLD